MQVEEQSLEEPMALVKLLLARIASRPGGNAEKAGSRDSSDGF